MSRASLVTPAAAGGHDVSVAPTVTLGPAAGAVPSGVSLETATVASSDLYGEIRFGTDPTATGSAGTVALTVTFGKPFATPPRVRVAPGNQTTAGRGVPYVQTSEITAEGFVVRFPQALAPNQAPLVYRLVYHVDGA